MIEVKLPQYGMGMSEGQVVRWLRTVGDTVTEGDPLVEIEAAKTTIEVPAPASGVLARIVAQDGMTIPVYETIAWIDQPGEDKDAV